MKGFAIVALAVKLLAGYVVVGGLTVVGIAFFSALVGGNWFGKDRGRTRWSDEEGFGLPPAMMFWAWPLALPIMFLFFLAKGGVKAIEVAGEAAEKVGTRRERELRGAKPL